MTDIKSKTIAKLNSIIDRNKSTKNRSCIICNKSSFFFEQNGDRNGINVNYGRCKNCNFLQLTTLTKKRFFDEYYSNYYSKISKNTENFDPRRHAFQRERGKFYFEFLIKEIGRKEFNDYHFIDYGCSSGGLVKVFEENKVKILGFDIDKKAINFGKKMGVKNLTSSDPFNKINKKSPLVVILSEVLEHMEDPKSFLKNLRSKMNERSILVISVPDLKGHLVHKRKLNFMYDLQHISYFTKNKLKEILNLSGFKSLSIYQKIIVGNGSLISVSMKGNYINEIKYDYSTSKYLFQLKLMSKITDFFTNLNRRLKFFFYKL